MRWNAQGVHTAREAGLKSQFSLPDTCTSCASRPVDVVYCTVCTRDTAGLIIATIEHLAGEGQITWNYTYDPSCRRPTHLQRIDINGTVAWTFNIDANRACTLYTPTAASGPPALDLSASGPRVVGGQDRVLTHGAFQRVRFGTTAKASGAHTCDDADLLHQPGTASVRRWIYADALNPVAQLDERTPHYAGVRVRKLCAHAGLSGRGNFHT